MSVVGWFWVCVAIAVLGLVYLFVHGRAVWHKLRLLLAEVSAASERAAEASRPGSHGGSRGDVA